MEPKVDLGEFAVALRNIMPLFIQRGKKGWLPKEFFCGLPSETKLTFALKVLQLSKEFSFDNEAAIEFIGDVHYEINQQIRDFSSLPREKQYLLAIKCAKLAILYFPKK